MSIVGYDGVLLAYGLLFALGLRYGLRRGRSQRLLLVGLLLAMAWILVLGLLDLLSAGPWWAYVWQRVAQMGLVLQALLTLEFASAFVQREGRPWLLFVLAGVLGLGAVALDMASIYLPSLVLPLTALSIGPVEVATLLLLAAWAAASGAAWWTALAALYRVRGYKHSNRVRYLIAALLGFTVGDVLVLVGGVPDIYVGFVARLLGFAIVTVALLRYDLPDLRRLVLSAIRIGLLVGITAAVYLAALAAAALLTRTLLVLPRLEILAPAAFLAVVVAAVVDVTAGPVLQRFFDRTVLGRTFEVQTALRAYGQQINLILDLERLADTTLDWMHGTMRVERSAFVLLSERDQERVELKVLRTRDLIAPEPLLFNRDSRFIAHFRNIGQPLTQYDLDMLTWFQVMPASERAWLKGLGCDLYIPILLPDRPVALLALGPKAGGQPYSADDLEILMILASQTATALENARLLDDLRTVQDDLQRLNSELAETNQQLKRLDQVKADFVTIASHELRTPLSQIFGYSDVLSSMKMDELGNSQMMNEFLAGISRGAKRLKRVVDAMVDVSLIETGTLKMHPIKIPISVVVSNAVSTVQPAADQRHLTLEVRNVSSLPYVEADGTRLEQVLVSLLTNAIKFSPDGKRIEVSGRFEEPPNDEPYVELAVTDEGIGIEPEQQRLIFAKFYRPENPMLHSTDDIGFKGAGPGLGLAIAKGIVDAHGGKLWVESAGRDETRCPGSTFFMRLPVKARVQS